MASTAANNLAYQRGEAARMRGKPFSSNPYRDPSCNVSWGLGWVDYGKSRRDKSVPKSIRRTQIVHLRKVK